jgi:hypothetical protein
MADGQTVDPNEPQYKWTVEHQGMPDVPNGALEIWKRWDARLTVILATDKAYTFMALTRGEVRSLTRTMQAYLDGTARELLTPIWRECFDSGRPDEPFWHVDRRRMFRDRAEHEGFTDDEIQAFLDDPPAEAEGEDGGEAKSA